MAFVIPECNGHPRARLFSHVDIKSHDNKHYHIAPITPNIYVLHCILGAIANVSNSSLIGTVFGGFGLSPLTIYGCFGPCINATMQLSIDISTTPSYNTGPKEL